MDILWRSEDQRVSHLNYTPTRKHTWASNEETSAGFTGNLSHIFLRTCSVDARVAGMPVQVLGETCHVASLRSLFPEATAAILCYKSYRDQQSSGNVGNMRQASTLK